MAVTSMTTFLWFDGQALPAAELYTSTFPDAVISSVDMYPASSGMPDGTVLTVSFSLFGQPFVALNGGPEFQHTPAVSFQVATDSQAETDRVWGALTADGGQEGRCGWCTDPFGVSWQVIPSRMGELMSDPREGAAARVWGAMMEMSKIDISTLEAAAGG